MVVPGADSGVLLKFRLWRESNIERLRKLTAQDCQRQEGPISKTKEKNKTTAGGSVQTAKLLNKKKLFGLHDWCAEPPGCGFVFFLRF